MMPSVVLVLTLCAGPTCVEQRPFDAMPSQFCAIQGQALAAEWLSDNGYLARGYTLAKYDCQAVRRERA